MFACINWRVAEFTYVVLERPGMGMNISITQQKRLFFIFGIFNSIASDSASLIAIFWEPVCTGILHVTLGHTPRATACSPQVPRSAPFPLCKHAYNAMKQRKGALPHNRDKLDPAYIKRGPMQCLFKSTVLYLDK